MDEEPLPRGWKIGCGVIAIAIAGIAAWLLYTLSVVSHDKSLNSMLQSVWSRPEGVPLRVVVPARNRWMENAFIADSSTDPSKPLAVLILDDHYRSGDYSLRSQSGVVGDRPGREVLCSVPAQARSARVELDPVVRDLITAECGAAR